MQSTAEQRLVELLMNLFSPQEMRRFLSSSTSTVGLVSAIADGSSLAELSAGVAGALVRMGITQTVPFWQGLSLARPDRQTDIDSVRELFVERASSHAVVAEWSGIVSHNAISGSRAVPADAWKLSAARSRPVSRGEICPAGGVILLLVTPDRADVWVLYADRPLRIVWRKPDDQFVSRGERIAELEGPPAPRGQMLFHWGRITPIHPLLGYAPPLHYRVWTSGTGEVGKAIQVASCAQALQESGGPTLALTMRPMPLSLEGWTGLRSPVRGAFVPLLHSDATRGTKIEAGVPICLVRGEHVSAMLVLTEGIYFQEWCVQEGDIVEVGDELACGSYQPLQSRVTFFRAPIVGTFFRAKNPDSPPFVEQGTLVNEGDVVCIIEASKVMMHIEADFSGVIEEVLVENAVPVQFGTPLFRVRRR